MQLLDRGLLDAAHRAEAAEQRPRAPRADARHRQELRSQSFLSPPRAVAAHGKSVGLVAGFAEHEVSWVRRVEAQGLRSRRQPHLLLTFGEGGQRQVETERVEGGHGGVELADAAVDQHQIRHRPLLVPQPSVTAAYRLGDRREIINPVDSTDVEAAVLTLVHAPVLPHHARGGGLTSPSVRDVEALDVGHRAGQTERFAQPAGEMLRLRARGTEAKIEGGAGVVQSELGLPFARSAPRRRHLHCMAPHVAEEGAQQLSILFPKLLSRVHPARNRRVGLVVLGEKAREEIRGGDLADALEVKLALVDQPTGTVGQHADRGVLAVGPHRHRIGVAVARPLHVLAFAQPLDHADQITVAGRHLEVFALGRRPHALLQPRQQPAVLAFEEKAQLLDDVGIGVRGGEPVDTRTQTGAHVVVETGTREPAVDLDLTGADLEVGAREIHELARHVLPHEGSEVGVTVI